VAGHIAKRVGKKKINGKPESLYYAVYTVDKKQKWEKARPSDPEKLAATREDAEKLLARRLNEIHSGEFIQRKQISFTEFSDIWMEKYAVGGGEIRPSTLATYRGFFRNQLLPAFGDKDLGSISVEDAQGFKAEMLKRGKKVKKNGRLQEMPLSPQTVKHLLRLLRQMLNHAIDWGYLKHNPVKKVKDPKIPRGEMDCLTLAEVQLLLEKVPDGCYALFLVAITGGLRIGEILAMRWANLDRGQGRYFVKETWLRSREGRPAVFGEPKTESSRAPVDLIPEALTALKKHRSWQAEKILAGGKDYKNQDLIFATALGGPLDDRHFEQRVFHKALADAGLRRIRFHDLRHTTASLLIAQNESPKYIQKQMRHASIEITFDRYGHLLPEARQEATLRLSKAIFGKSSDAASDN